MPLQIKKVRELNDKNVILDGTNDYKNIHDGNLNNNWYEDFDINK